MLKLLACLLSLCLLTLEGSGQKKITVAVAANMKYAIDEVIREFTKTNPLKVDIVVGASGHLTQQIMHGAPFHIFISADKEFPQTLSTQGQTVGKPRVYAQGILVTWTVRPGITPSQGLKELLKKDVKRIAIANVKTAPYGKAAEFILKKYGLYDKVSGKLVTGESITQASQFIVTQNADIGFTAKSVVISQEMKDKGQWVELKLSDYPPIDQSAVLLKHSLSDNSTDAKAFYDFLFSAKANAIYQKSGYIVK